jgi:nucleoside-diphosphate-sugar epimerase
VSRVLIFLTGATGFLGGALARALRADGHTVRALVRNPAAAAPLASRGVELHPGDITDKASMRAPMTGVDGVFHVAGWYKIGLRDRQAAVAINIEGTRHVLELMQELGIRKGVYTSTLAVNSDTRGTLVDESFRFEGRHVTVYDWSKHEAHKVADEFITRGLPLTIVQPGLIYGPGDTSGVRTMLLQYLQRKLPAVPSGPAYCWAHVDDEADGHILAMEKGTPGRNYFLAGPAHTLVEALEIAASVTGIPVPKRRLAPAVLKAAAAVMRVPAAVLPLPPSMAPESLRLLAGVTYLGDATRARTELGWRPRPLREGLEQTLRHEMQLLGMKP